MTGTIESITNHFTVVQFLIRTDEGIYPLAVDPRAYYAMEEIEGDMVGREIEIHGEPFEEWIEFLD